MAVPLIVALGRSSPLNRSIEVAQNRHDFSEGQLKQMPGRTRPRMFWPANRQRKTITIYAPTDGAGAYIGGDSSVTPEWATLLPAGQSFTITAYYGPIWVVAEEGLQRVFVVET